ncbi:MAG: DNA-3-methyladenine glycosylase family protein [Acidimicrobiales bacterium]
MPLVVETEMPIDLAQTLGPLRHGGVTDPCMRITADGVWRASRYASGPATVHLRAIGRCRIEVSAWGAGAAEALACAPALLGATDDDGGLTSCAHPTVRRLAHRFVGLRMSRSGNPMEAMVPTILGQKVQGQMARRSFCAMVRAARMFAPVADHPNAPALMLQPDPAWLLAQPSWAWHRWNVERRRAVTIRTAAAAARRVEATTRLPATEAVAYLCRLPGVGVWTAAEVAMAAFGDPDAVSVGDYWLKHWVCATLAGEARGTDDRMLDLLAPWSGQRGRVCRLILAGGTPPPRFGPRLALHDISTL